ncbi:hypothetical protein TSOC_000855 [Tetrabaena socialis]|uniref:Uncharacterized protein n=1 Tax=Tetrabaena socialis TaxID=47790 RepID=A0A2J8AI90_9CHLO|nr:hypothetical protein TSOC_000855 [Tetrabaena socialis]|eukprot:PNH12228.1 hypothetical protein TSOC_000855 [Tetrabaena socialis]
MQAQERDDADPLAAALEAAAAGARASANALEAERAARQGAEARLREAKVAAERKGAMLKEMKRRVDDLEAAVQQHASALGADAAAESRARTLAASVVRKDAVIRELRDRLEAAQVAAVAGSTAAEAGSEELEAARRAGVRLRADLAKRDASLRVTVADLEKERRMLAAATKQLCELSKREASARRQAASAISSLRSRAAEVLEALRALCRVLLQAVAAMDGATSRLLLVPGALAATGAAPAPGGSGLTGRAAGGGGGSMTADAISQLTSLSLEDVQHLLGSETRPYGDGGGGLYGNDGGGGAAALEAARVVGDLLSVVEVALAAAPTGPGVPLQEADQGAEELQADGSLLRDQLLAAVAASGDPAAAAAAVLGVDSWAGRLLDMAGGPEPAGRRGGPGSGGAEGQVLGGDPWDRRALGVLVERVHVEARRAESALAAAVQRGGGR